MRKLLLYIVCNSILIPETIFSEDDDCLPRHAACFDAQIFFKQARKKMLKGLNWTNVAVSCTLYEGKKKTDFIIEKTNSKS